MTSSAADPSGISQFEHEAPVVAVGALGATVHVSRAGVTIDRELAASVLLPARTVLPRDDIRGWEVTEFTDTVLLPATVELLCDGVADAGVLGARGSQHCVRFVGDTGRGSEFDVFCQALTAMQADDVPALEQLRAQSTLTEQDLAAQDVPALGVPAGVENPASTPSAQPDVEFLDAPGALIALDVETANGNSGSICQIGFVYYENGVEVESHSWLCQPPWDFGGFLPGNIDIHGITPADVANEPSCRERLWELSDFLRAHPAPLVAHNARFDMTAITEAAAAEGVDLPPFEFGCTYLWSQGLGKKGRSYKLPDVAALAGYDLKDHHEALADARACGHIALWLAGEVAAMLGHPGKFVSYRDIARAADFTMGKVSGAHVDHVMRTPKPEPKPEPEPAHTGPRWASVVAPSEVPQANEDADPQGRFYGQVVVCTGEFGTVGKGELWQALAERGATVAKGVTKKTTVLIVGDWDSVTSKEKKALQLIEKGQPIEILRWNEIKQDLFPST